MKIKYRVASIVATGTLALGLLAPAAFADNTGVISGNGANSINSVSVTTSSNCTVKQTSNTIAEVQIDSSANTGGNTASFNTGGDVSITTGDASNTVGVSVMGGSNTADNPCCGCLTGGTNTAVITGNGTGSINANTVNSTSNHTIKQKTNTQALIGIGVKSKTGHNNSSFNTNGSTTVTTGNSSNTVGVTVSGGSNSI